MIEPKTVKVLDHGEVTLIDVFGSDDRIAEVARGSYKKGTKRISTNEQLIRYLVRHNHASPIEFGQIIVHMVLPIVVVKQLVRHRTIKMNEASLRYSEASNIFYLPEIEQCGTQSTNNKQGRNEVLTYEERIVAAYLQSTLRDANIDAAKYYNKLIDGGMSREVARNVLPVSLYTELSVSWDIRNLLHFLKLRMDPHAQWEIRQYANTIYELVKPYFPATFKAWEDYILNAHSLSALDQILLISIPNILTDTPSEEYAISIGMSKREYSDFCSWLTKLRK